MRNRIFAVLLLFAYSPLTSGSETHATDNALKEAAKFSERMINDKAAAEAFLAAPCILNIYVDRLSSAGATHYGVNLKDLDPERTQLSGDRTLHIETTNLAEEIPLYRTKNYFSSQREDEYLRMTSTIDILMFDRESVERTLKALRFAINRCGGKKGW